MNKLDEKSLLSSAKNKNSQFKEKLVKKDWEPLSKEDMVFAEKYFLHLSGKAISSLVNNVGIRLPDSQPRSDLPYISLCSLGATFDDLDFNQGGAKNVTKPRQMKDLLTNKSSGVERDMAKIPEEDKFLLNQEGDFAAALKNGKNNIPKDVPPLLRQIIVKDNQLGDVSLTPIAAMGLSSRIMKALNNELNRRREEKPDTKVFWGRAQNIIGGKKPQNIGLMCAVSGGPALAGFAWHFKAPGFPKPLIRKLYLSVFKPLRFDLSNEQRTKLVLPLRRWLESDDLRTTIAIEGVLKSLAQDMLMRAESSSNLIMSELKKDYCRSGLVVNSHPLECLFKDEMVPIHKEDFWYTILSKNSVEQGWLYDRLRSHTWAIDAADKLINHWVVQLKIALGSSHHKKIVAILAKEIYS